MEIIYFYINFIVNIYILIAVYYYCIKTYGINATVITNICLSSMVLTLIFTDTYSVADLGTDVPFSILKVGKFEFSTDIITIFTVFVVIFELARFSLKKPKGSDLSMKNIIAISIIVTLYGILFQLLMDPTAAAMGLYYYQNPPAINIFGFPIWFITAFAIYGLYAFVFLLIERYYFQKSNRTSII